MRPTVTGPLADSPDAAPAEPPIMLHLAAYLHDLDPYVFGTPIRWYGLSYLVGFALAFVLIRWLNKRGKRTLRSSHVWDFVIAVAIGTVIGGRLGYVFFYDITLLWQWSDELPYWGVLALNRGGMASHGGIIGMIAAAALFAKVNKQPLGYLADLITFSAGLGVFFGRIANFINGELYGRGPTDVPWAVKFPQEMLVWIGPDGSEDQRSKFNRLVYELEQRGLVPQEVWEHVERLRKYYSNHPLESEAILEFYPLAQWMIQQVQQGSVAVRQIVEPALIARHPSQLYAAVMEGLVVLGVTLWFWRRPRKPWFISGVGTVTYSLMRIANEQFRQPDPHIADEEFAAIGITRGQWLSVLLLLVGVGLILWSRRGKHPSLGGWQTPPEERGLISVEMGGSKRRRPQQAVKMSPKHQDPPPSAGG